MAEVHIKVKTRLSSDLKGSHLIISKFHEACELLDASIFEPFIEEEDIFEDVGKWEFLQNLKGLFDEVLEVIGPERLDRQQGQCTFCHPDAAVTEYVEPKSGMVLFAYYFEIKEGQLTDVYQCNLSDGYCAQHPKAADLLRSGGIF